MPDHDLTSDLPAPSTGLGSRALRNTILVLTAKVIARLIALVTVLAMIKYLKAAPYGTFATVVNYTAIVSVVLDLGFNMPSPNPQPGQQQLLFKVTDRVIMTYPTAKRLALSLGQLIKRYEQQFGELPTTPGPQRK